MPAPEPLLYDLPESEPAHKELSMAAVRLMIIMVLTTGCAAFADDFPGPLENGYQLPNGWKITPVGKSIETMDYVLNLQPAPDGRVVVGVNGGFNGHGLTVISTKTGEKIQKIPLATAWFGLAWNPAGDQLYVSGGNSTKEGVRAPVYIFSYKDGLLSEKPERKLAETVAPEQIYWSGLVQHPQKNVLYAANRTANNIVVFDLATDAIVTRIATGVNPYDLVLSQDGKTLYCSNWASDSVTVIDTETNQATDTIAVGDNPNDMVLSGDGRLFVCCSNENKVVVVDTKRGRAVESIYTSLTEKAPEGSTPNAVALDPKGQTLYVANAGNCNLCVADVEEAGESRVLGFVPTGWYPTAVTLSNHGRKLYIGNARGNGSYADIRGPHSPLPPGKEGNGTVKSLLRGSINVADTPRSGAKLRKLTAQCLENSPYNDALLSEARPPKQPSVIPSKVGKGSPIKHVIYVLQENRTFDQVLGDMGKGNCDPRLTIFGRDVTPNRHAIADQFVLLDNLYCDAEVSQNGHPWSAAAYATDWVEKLWPVAYGGKSDAPDTDAKTPHSGYIWDICKTKGLSYRSYGECASRVSTGAPMESNMPGLRGHIAPNYLGWGARDTENAAAFIKEFDEYEANYDSADPEKRLPNFIFVSLPEDHTRGTSPGAPTPRAAVASSDYALGMIVDRISHSRYWPELALMTIEDDAQDGADHVDARRTVGLVVSPYCRRGIVDSTFYTTSAMLRTIELLLGLPPMSQFDAAGNPMYASFADTPDLTPYTHLKPTIDIQEQNIATACGARESMAMDFSEVDKTPMFDLNEIVWKSVKGADSPMPLPVHRFHLAEAGVDGDG
jgi:YVTN family beta-propeller protein